MTLEAVTAAGNRPAERWRRTVANAAGRTFEVATPTGDPWPDAAAAPLVVAIFEGEANALALARLRLPGVLVRAAGGTAGVRRGAAVVADLPAATAACLVSDGDRPGRAAVTKLHADLHDAGRACYSAVLIGCACLACWCALPAGPLVFDAAPPWWRTCQRRRPLAWYLMATGPDAPR